MLVIFRGSGDANCAEPNEKVFAKLIGKYYVEMNVPGKYSEQDVGNQHDGEDPKKNSFNAV
jgi:hypothetical protein